MYRLRVVDPVVALRVTRTKLAWLACSVGLAVVLPMAVAYLQWFPGRELDTQSVPLRDRTWLLVIGRRPERSFEAETSIPFRNSPMALYEHHGGAWIKREGDLMTRSTSSSTSRPLETDIPTVLKCLEAETAYGYGYLSVPCGAYWLAPANPSSHETRWLISDWGTLDGVVSLEEAETVGFCKVDSSTSQSARIVDVPGISRRGEKRGTFLHGTVTRYWSHVDSRGCINLCVEPESAGGTVSPWEEFMGWVRKHGLLSQGLGLVLVPCDDLTSDPASPLPQSLAMRVVPSSAHGGCQAHVSPLAH